MSHVTKQIKSYEPLKNSPLYDETKQFLYKLGKDHTIQYTPAIIVNDIMKQIPFNENDSALDPFAGDNVFYDDFPIKDKRYCEIEKGLDFFEYTDKVDWIISNPPFRIFQDEKKLNAFPLIMDKSIKIANKGVGFLINWKLFNALTVPRLKKWQPFNITKLKVYEIKQWYGRYFFVLFEKNKESIIDF